MHPPSCSRGVQPRSKRAGQPGSYSRRPARLCIPAQLRGYSASSSNSSIVQGCPVSRAPSRASQASSRGPAEIVVGDVQGHARLQVLQLFREPQRQPSEPPEEGADGQVMSLDVGRAYFGAAKGALYRLGGCAYHFRRPVPPRLLRFLIVLDDRRCSSRPRRTQRPRRRGRTLNPSVEIIGRGPGRNSSGADDPPTPGRS